MTMYESLKRSGLVLIVGVVLTWMSVRAQVINPPVVDSSTVMTDANGVINRPANLDLTGSGIATTGALATVSTTANSALSLAGTANSTATTANGTANTANATANAAIPKAAFTGNLTFLSGTGAGTYATRNASDFRTDLGLGTAATNAATAFATAAQGTKADNIANGSQAIFLKLDCQRVILDGAQAPSEKGMSILSDPFGIGYAYYQNTGGSGQIAIVHNPTPNTISMEYANDDATVYVDGWEDVYPASYTGSPNPAGDGRNTYTANDGVDDWYVIYDCDASLGHEGRWGIWQGTPGTGTLHFQSAVGTSFLPSNSGGWTSVIGGKQVGTLAPEGYLSTDVYSGATVMFFSDGEQERIAFKWNP